MNAVKLTGKPDRGLRRFQQLLWSSALYRRGYWIAAALTRPFRRLELATLFRQDLTGQLELFDADIDVGIGLASMHEVEWPPKLWVVPRIRTVAQNFDGGSSTDAYAWSREQASSLLAIRGLDSVLVPTTVTCSR